MPTNKGYPLLYAERQGFTWVHPLNSNEDHCNININHRYSAYSFIVEHSPSNMLSNHVQQ